MDFKAESDAGHKAHVASSALLRPELPPVSPAFAGFSDARRGMLADWLLWIERAKPSEAEIAAEYEATMNAMRQLAVLALEGITDAR